MSLSDLSGQPSLSRLLDRSEIPSRAVGIFWLGGPSLVLKSPSQRVYLFDPEFSNWNGRIPVGAIDVRPDVVVGTGVSRSGLGPGDSARASCTPPVPSNGRIAMDNTMIPMPPIHWVSARHHRTPWLRAAGSGTTDDPVVVIPAAVSKNASVIPSIDPVTR